MNSKNLTCLWCVGIEKRRSAKAVGIHRWTDPRCSAATFWLTGHSAKIFQSILEINRTAIAKILPDYVTAAAPSGWANPVDLEFYVDFETVSDFDDDFTRLPLRAGQPMIFMIGCGHQEAGTWKYRCFIADALTEDCEAQILAAWLAHMRSVQAKIDPDGPEPLVVHWSKAETANIRDAYNSAIARHSAQTSTWATPRWFDLLTEVIRAEPVVVQGALGFHPSRSHKRYTVTT